MSREEEVLLAIYTFDMSKLSKEMADATEYDKLADIYLEGSELIRKFDKDMKELTDGND